MPVTVTRDSHYCTCLGHLVKNNTDRIISIFCSATQGGCHVKLSLIVKRCFLVLVKFITEDSNPICTIITTI